MRMITLITDLVIERVPYYGDSEMTLHEIPPLNFNTAEEGFIQAEIERHVVPLVQICKQTDKGRDETFIAYSPKVEELIGVPINLVYRDLKTSQQRNAELARRNTVLSDKWRRVRLMTFWDRLKYALTGKIPPEAS